MRRFLFGVVIASAAAVTPAWAYGGDREIAKAVMAELQQHKAAGQLKGFDIDLKVEDGVVYLNGKVANSKQRKLVADAALSSAGKGNLVNNLTVTQVTPVAAAPVRLPDANEGTIAPETKPNLLSRVRKASGKGLIPKLLSRKSEEVAQPQPVRTVQTQHVQPEPVQHAQPVRTVSGQRSAQPTSSDVAITDAIIGKLQGHKSTGRLRGFELDVSTVNGDVWLRGKVGSPNQKQLIVDAARKTRGVSRVIDDIAVTASKVQQVSTAGGLSPAQGAPTPVPQPQPVVQQGSSMPVVGHPGQMAPQAFAPSGLASMQSGVPGGHPVAMNAQNYGAGAPRYDQPNMPSYAWPSYSAYPNYAAVTYPQQYSPSAWPYIGPFYPYPQVPLGWRKVALEWDDGLWYLDFTSK